MSEIEFRWYIFNWSRNVHEEKTDLIRLVYQIAGTKTIDRYVKKKNQQQQQN